MDNREQGSHARVYIAHRNSKAEARGRNRHKNNERVVRNLEERNVGT